MKNLFKPASLLFYFLVFLCFFIVGTTFAVLIDAAKDQGLAGSAIVLGYGVMSGFFAVVISFFLALYLPLKSIVKMNRILSAVLLLLILIAAIRFYMRKKSGSAEAKQNHITESIYIANSSTGANNHPQNPPAHLGLGFFKPDLRFPAIYFYGNPNVYKSEHNFIPSDSLIFGKTDFGKIDIVYAPPWFFPDVLKMDYEMLFLRLHSVGNVFVEIIVNRKTQQTAFVKKFQGEVIHWPDFLLQVHSVEMLPEEIQPVRIKALNHAAEIRADYVFMKPIIVRNEWLFVELQKQDLQPAGSGWIQWKDGNNLLISYSLLH